MTKDQKRIKQLEKALAGVLDACTELVPNRLGRGYNSLYTCRPEWERIEDAREVLPTWEPKAKKK